MAALAYVLLPLSGTIAFLVGGSRRMRFHGLQAIALGVVWALVAYLGSWVSPRLTQVVFALGSLVWIWLILATLLGGDPRLPGGRFLERALADDPPD